MASVQELIRFIGARLDEDAEVVAQNSDGRGLANGFPDYRTYSDEDTSAADQYIEHFNPIRLRAEVETKRKILAAWDDIDYDLPLYLLDALAEPYLGHPDYPRG